ncbi:hypothetical protein [Arachidicoccus soli]|nr:hypothetical protein [Arachidicoccus soli]
MNSEVFIISPTLSRENVSANIMTLIGVIENYPKEVGNIDLKIRIN